MKHKQITIAQALEKIQSGMTLMVGGFLANGSALTLLNALAESDKKDFTVICNDTAFADKGVGRLFAEGKVKKVITSYLGTNKPSQDQMHAGTLTVEFVPQGTLAERIRCGGCGLGGVLTPTGTGTLVAEGKQTIHVDGRDYLLEKPLRADIALIGAGKGDATGNLVYLGTAQNFNPLMAMAADLVIAEIDELLPVGAIAPEQVHTPAILVDFIAE
ncbi:MAG: CoA transferase subunit A [Prevotellaceae bacterium]|jgi:acetate CoA/acetoacetate CoA-transferase alpha subunit|nr:CoA transferase subunit A [Prevotellaceae bacterium]